MLSSIFQRKFQILGIVTLLSGLTGLYIYKKRNNKKQNRQKQESKIHITNQSLNDSRTYEPLTRFQIQKSTSVFSQYYFDKNLQSRKVLDHLDNEGITVQSIYKYSPIIAVDQFNKFTKQIRKRRRLIRTINQDQYINIILNYELQIQQLLQRSRQQVVYDCEIDPQQFENMKNVFQATEDLSILMRDAKKYLKQLTFTKKRQISKNILQKIINQQLSFIRGRVYDRLRIKLQNEFDLSQDDILKVIHALIDDIAYQKFGFQREQIQNSLKNQWSYDLMKQIRELAKARQQLQSDIGNFSLVSQQSEAQQQIQKNCPSQGLTRSGANSEFLQQEEQN